MSPAQRQHIVPEFILNGFPKAGTKRLYGFDKWNDRIFETTPEKAAKENGFYDFEMNGVSASFEEPLQQLESKTAPIIRKLIRDQRLANLSEEEKVGLALFCSVQLLRDKNSIAAGLDFRDKLIEKVNKFRFGPDKEKAKGFQIPSDDDMKRSVLIHMASAPKYIPMLMVKSWSLQITPPGTSLYISDSPVTLDNERTFGPYGNLGLLVPGIQISLPLSSSVNLWLACHTIENDFRESYQKAALAKIPLTRPSMVQIKSLLDSFRGTKPFRMDSENVVRVNSLQVGKAERFVYSETDDFSLARKMIGDNQAFKKGRRMKVG